MMHSGLPAAASLPVWLTLLLLLLLLLLNLQRAGETNSEVVLMREACYRCGRGGVTCTGEGRGIVGQMVVFRWCSSGARRR